VRSSFRHSWLPLAFLLAWPMLGMGQAQAGYLMADRLEPGDKSALVGFATAGAMDAQAELEGIDLQDPEPQSQVWPPLVPGDSPLAFLVRLGLGNVGKGQGTGTRSPSSGGPGGPQSAAVLRPELPPAEQGERLAVLQTEDHPAHSSSRLFRPPRCKNPSRFGLLQPLGACPALGQDSGFRCG
jgi:hypothetical protein